MKERPILMNAFSVRGIFDDRKSVTRRIQGLEGLNDSRVTVHGRPLFSEEGYWQVKVDDSPYNFRCPYGVVSDRLWVRETWKVSSESNHYPTKEKRLWLAYRASMGIGGGRHGGKQTRTVFSTEDEDVARKAWGRNRSGTWRPSIFMPRWASRLLLEVKDIRVERLQEITRRDIVAEGIAPAPGDSVHQTRHDFGLLWDSINAKPKPAYARDEKGKRVIDHYVSYPWEDVQETRTHRGKPWHVIGNPWVFVVGFRSAAA